MVSNHVVMHVSQHSYILNHDHYDVGGLATRYDNCQIVNSVIII